MLLDPDLAQLRRTRAGEGSGGRCLVRRGDAGGAGVWAKAVIAEIANVSSVKISAVRAIRPIKRIWIPRWT